MLTTSQRELIVHIVLIALVIFVAMYAVMFVRRRAAAGRLGSGDGTASSSDDEMQDEKHTTAKLLHAANATVYGSRQCGYTVRQMERFGPHADMIDYVECGADSETSTCKGIRGFPTWKIGSATLMGDQSLHALRAAAERALQGSDDSASARGARRQPVDDEDEDEASSSDDPMAMDTESRLHPTL